MARIDYKISVTPIQAASALEGKTVEAIDAEVGKTVGGGNSSLTWDGNDIDNWAAGVYTYIESVSTDTAVAATGDNGVFIKHTGKAYDSSKTNNIDNDTANTEAVTVRLASVDMCELGAGDCIFIPTPKGTINIKSADDTGPAIQTLKLT
jgi:hypothetical protein